MQFEELLSLDAETLAQLHPVYGVIFLFKFPTDQPYTAADRPHDGEFDRGAADRLFFAAQTIQNACATQALLSVLLNKTDAEAGADGDGSPDQRVDVGADLRAFRDFAMALPPDLRGEALSNSELIRDVHNSFARASPFADETRRAARDPSEAEDAFHFVAYTAVGGTLYELDGLQPAPISHGACGADGEQFAARVMEVLRRRVARYSDGEIRFNLLAVVRDLRLRARELGDAEMLARETARRREWLFENALRRHNFVALPARCSAPSCATPWPGTATRVSTSGLLRAWSGARLRRGRCGGRGRAVGTTRRMWRWRAEKWPACLSVLFLTIWLWHCQFCLATVACSRLLILCVPIECNMIWGPPPLSRSVNLASSKQASKQSKQAAQHSWTQLLHVKVYLNLQQRLGFSLSRSWMYPVLDLKRDIVGICNLCSLTMLCTHGGHHNKPAFYQPTPRRSSSRPTSPARENKTPIAPVPPNPSSKRECA